SPPPPRGAQGRKEQEICLILEELAPVGSQALDLRTNSPFFSLARDPGRARGAVVSRRNPADAILGGEQRRRGERRHSEPDALGAGEWSTPLRGNPSGPGHRSSWLPTPPGVPPSRAWGDCPHGDQPSCQDREWRGKPPATGRRWGDWRGAGARSPQSVARRRR